MRFVPIAIALVLGLLDPAEGTAKDETFLVQVAVFAERTSADSLATKLQEQGYPALVSEGAVFSVRVGPVSRKRAEEIQGRLKTEGLHPFIVKDAPTAAPKTTTTVAPSTSAEKRCWVSGYTTKKGKHVAGYWRKCS